LRRRGQSDSSIHSFIRAAGQFGPPRFFYRTIDITIDKGPSDADKWADMEDSLFAKIIQKKIPAKVAYEDEQYIVIHDIKPAAPVHLLVITKRQIPTLNDLVPEDAELVGGMFLVAKKLMADLGHRDYRTVFNCGPGAQQSVFHLHLHVLAGRAFTWPPG
jgi:histidine triad (HIT) family protein